MNVSPALAIARPAYKMVAFSRRFADHLDHRGPHAAPASRAVARGEVVELAARLRAAGVPVAQDDIILRVHGHNPDVIRLAGRDDGGEPAFLAYLPLRPAGFHALITGTLDRRAPPIDLLCGTGEVAAGIYLWSIYTPGRFMPAMAAIVAHFDTIMAEGVPMFTSAATPAAERLFAAMGFVRAIDFFPAIQADVLVVMPQEPV